MKAFCLSLIAILAAGTANAGEVLKVFQSSSAPAQYKTISAFKNTSSGTENSYSVVGDVNKYEVLSSNALEWIYPSSNHIIHGDTILVEMNGVTHQSANFKFIDKRTRAVIFEGLYTEVSKEQLKPALDALDAKVEAEFTTVRSFEPPVTPAQVRRMFRQVQIDFGDSVDGVDQATVVFPFPTYDLQIESYFRITQPDAKLARAEINPDTMTDEISKKFVGTGHSWARYHEDAQEALEQALEREEDIEGKKFISYNMGGLDLEGMRGRLKLAIESQMKYMILEHSGFNCEGSVYTYKKATWILKDGSTIQYEPGTECD